MGDLFAEPFCHKQWILFNAIELLWGYFLKSLLFFVKPNRGSQCALGGGENIGNKGRTVLKHPLGNLYIL